MKNTNFLNFFFSRVHEIFHMNSPIIKPTTTHGMWEPTIKEDIFDLIRKGDINEVYNTIRQNTERNYLNLEDCRGLSLLDYSINHNKIDIAKLLIYLGANKEHWNNNGEYIDIKDTVKEKGSKYEILLNEQAIRDFGQNFVTQIEKFEIAKLGEITDCCCVMYTLYG